MEVTPDKEQIADFIEAMMDGDDGSVDLADAALRNVMVSKIKTAMNTVPDTDDE